MVSDQNGRGSNRRWMKVQWQVNPSKERQPGPLQVEGYGWPDQVDSSKNHNF
jgi:hypothetical protein